MSYLLLVAWVLAGAVLILPVARFMRLGRRLLRADPAAGKGAVPVTLTPGAEAGGLPAGADGGDTAEPDTPDGPTPSVSHSPTRRLTVMLSLFLYVGFIGGAVHYVPQILSWALDTPHPLAAVSSQSMWPTLRKGDMILLRGVDGPEDLEVGDIVAFQHEKGITVHRVLEIDGDLITTQGDGNPVEDKPIQFDRVVGRVVTVGGRLAKVPYVGSVAGLFGPLATQAGQAPEDEQDSTGEATGSLATPGSSELVEGQVGPGEGPGSASPGTTELVSVDSAGNQADGPSTMPAVSADGRFVAFASAAGNLAPGDGNGERDIFVHDRSTGTTDRVSVDSAGNQANASSASPAISADGRFVAFVSAASNLVPGDSNGYDDVFIHDRETGATERVSVGRAGSQANDHSSLPAISANGRFVAFVSAAGNLVPGDTNSERDVFVHDRQTGITERVSVDSAGNQANVGSTSAAMSADGRFVAFASLALNLVQDDTNGESDVFVRDRQTGITERVSVDSDGSEGDGRSRSPAISADGRFVAFESEARDLVPRDFNRDQDVFVHDRQTGATERVSVNSAGKQTSNPSSSPAISGDGRFVAFEAGQGNLVEGDINRFLDVFIHDRQTGLTELVSVRNDGGQGNDHSGLPAVSRDGRFVAFWTWATNLVPAEAKHQLILVRDREAADTEAQ